jgi:Tol biopolymer transport system component
MKQLVLVALLALAAPASAAAPRVLASQDVDPVWSPTGAAIAFTRVYAYRDDLLVLDLRTHRVTTIASARGKLLPSWSDDGTFLAYQAGGIWVAGADGKVRTRVVANGFAPAWRPGTSELAWITSSGSLQVDGAPWAGGAIGRPSWSPDGSQLAFERSDGIYVAAAPDTATRVAAPGPEVLAAAWSHDGTRLAYSALGRVWVVPADGSSPPAAVTPHFTGLGTPSWANADDALAYMRAGGLGFTYLNGRSLLLRQTSFGSAGDARVAPTGELIAYAGPRDGCRGHSVIKAYEDAAAHDPQLTGGCEIRGTPAGETIWGTSLGGDAILAGAGNDVVHASNRHTDRVDCGPGRDTVYADRQDKLRGCERVL